MPMDFTGWEPFSYPGVVNMQDPGNAPFMTASYGIHGSSREGEGDPGNRPFDVDEGTVLRERGVLPQKVATAGTAAPDKEDAA
jgi:hypothetical protein